MPHVARFILIPLLAAVMTEASWATEGAIETTRTAEYKRSDANFYPKADIVKAHPSAVILSAGSYTQTGDSYFITPHKKAPKEIYLELRNDWIEPITPPGATSLGIAPDAMEIREPQGDVQVALPNAPANFAPATEGMTLPNGAVVKTGANGTAAVLFGGVDSARLMPNSEAAVQQTVTAQTRSVEVDLTAGGVFSKVGTQIGVKGVYEVHTPFANAIAHGTDFVTVVTPARTDVWIAQGTVELHPPDAQAQVATSDGAGKLKLLRFPQISDAHLALLADTETFTTAQDFIPLANQKIKALRAKVANGLTLTATEQAYLDRIKSVPCLIKLALVKPPTPAPTAMPTPLAAPSTPPASVSVPASPAIPAGPAPIRAVVRTDGKINFKGATYELPGFKSKLEALVKATPDQSIVIRAGKTVPYAKFKAVLDVCRDANVKYVTIATPAMPAADTEPATANLPTPGLLMHPAMEPASSNANENPPTTNAPPVGGP